MELIDPRNVAEVFFDGIHDVKITRGIVRIVLFSRQDGTGIVEARLRCPLAELPDIIQGLVIALTNAARSGRKPT